VIRAFIYGKAGLQETNNTDEIIETFNQKDKIIWVDMEEPSEEETEILDKGFHFHPLAVESCLKGLERPRINNYDDYFFIIMHAVIYTGHRREIKASEFNIFISATYVVTFHKNKLDFVQTIAEMYRKDPALFEKGTDFLIYNLIDALVDEYYPFLDKVDDRLNSIEERIFKKPDQNLLNDLFKLRRSITRLRRIILPQRDIVNLMLRHDFNYLKEENRPYFMDVYDHLTRLFDMVDLYHDMIITSMDAYLSSVSNNMNNVMKVLTIITTILMPLTVITGVYGMNFDMPELKWRYGYPWALSLMALSVTIMIIYIRRKKWL